jgi:hypothetical protein
MARTPEELAPDNTGASGRSLKTEGQARPLNEIGAYEVALSQRSFPVIIGNPEITILLALNSE